MSEYDYIIIGSGAAGSVLASRLSAKPGIQVLLIEAGPDMPPGSEPVNVRDPFPGALGGKEFTWPGLTAEIFPAREGRPALRRNLIQGKVIGGSSTINGMMAQRGLPADFDEWETCGAIGWGWQDVLPYFNALERDLDYRGEMHGSNGPIPIRREKKEDWAPFSKAVTHALLNGGYPWFDDFNGQFEDGVSRVPLNNLPDRRVSASMAYLDDRTRARDNLKILTDTQVLRLQYAGSRVIGVEVQAADGAGVHTVRPGGEVIVSGGAIHSPTLLLRSGIGPADELRALGIPVLADRPGVGRNLLNHAMIHIATHLPRSAMQNVNASSWAFTVLRYSSGVEGCSRGDMQIFPINRTAWHALGRRIGAMGLCLYRPFSVGSVQLRSKDPTELPDVRFNMLTDERDVVRLMDGLRRMLILLNEPGVRPLRNEVFIPDKAKAGRLASRTQSNRLKTAVINAAFSISPWLRRAALKDSLIDSQALIHDDAALRKIVETVTAHVHHVCGTCRLGDQNDPLAVVDPQCRVYGVDGLRVVDASIMPRNISANTHLATLMIAEKAAAHLLAERLTDQS